MLANDNDTVRHYPRHLGQRDTVSLQLHDQRQRLNAQRSPVVQLTYKADLDVGHPDGDPRFGGGRGSIHQCCVCRLKLKGREVHRVVDLDECIALKRCSLAIES